MQTAQPTQPTDAQATVAATRWISQRDLMRWLRAFRTYFPRKAHLAERAAARLAGAPSFEDLRTALPDTPRNEKPDGKDPLYAKRRMVRFTEDRLILIREFRILPDAADQFLTSCPVGCQHCFFDGIKDSYFDEALCYYRDDQDPSDRIEAIVERQRQQALAQRLSQVDATQRLGGYMHPLMVRNLFHFLRWDFTPDLDGSDGIDVLVPATRVGWVADSELGSVECFSLAFTAHPNWGRDEVFYSVLAQLRETRDLSNQPVLLLNKWPQQLIQAGHTYTAYGWIVAGSKVLPLMVSHRPISLADLLVELATFDAASSSGIADDSGVALQVFWTLLREYGSNLLPATPAFNVMPDNWMILS